MEPIYTDNHFIIIDLTVRLTSTEAQQLSLAAARAHKDTSGVPKPLPTRGLIEALDEARRLLKIRRTREQHFGDDLFSDPSWDMLLDLFVAESSPRKTSVSSACLGSCAPSTTALRHLATLERKGWVIREASPKDQRVVYVRLSDAAIAVMTKLLGQ